MLILPRGYKFHLRSSFKKCTLNKLRVAYNNCLRRLMSIVHNSAVLAKCLFILMFGHLEKFVEKWFLTLLIDLKE